MSSAASETAVGCVRAWWEFRKVVDSTSIHNNQLYNISTATGRSRRQQ